MYVTALSRLSSTPTSGMCGLFGIHTCPPYSGGRPPDLVGLEDGDRGASFVGDDRRRQPGRTGPQHDDVKPFHGPLLPVGVPGPADGTDTGVESQPI